MKVHLARAVSSPGCANFALQRAAEDGERQFGKPAADFVKRDFYVDDGLTSVPTTEEAVNLITNTKALCARKSTGLHRFASNDKEVLKAIPANERADCVRDIEVIGNSTPIERVLGIQWSLEDDCFRFRITLKDRPATRRGILSVVSAVYDPLVSCLLLSLAARESYRTSVETKQIGMLRSLKIWFFVGASGAVVYRN